MWPFRKPQWVKVARRDVMKARLCRDPRVEEERLPDGSLNLIIRRREEGATKALAMVFAIPRKRSFNLDETGEWFWERCDGKQPLSGLVRLVAERFDLNEESAQKSVLSYVSILTRRGLVAFDIAPDATAAAAEPTSDVKESITE